MTVARVSVVHPGYMRHAGTGSVRGARLVVAGASQVIEPLQCKTCSLLSCDIDFGLCVSWCATEGVPVYMFTWGSSPFHWGIITGVAPPAVSSTRRKIH